MAAPLLALAGCSGQATEEPIWIGHVGPLSGPERSAGESMKRGILLAIEEANAEGQRIAGRTLSVLHADSRGQAERARPETVRLITLNRIAALIGGRDYLNADRLAQALQPYTAPLLTPACVVSPNLEGVSSLDVSPHFRGQCLARFAAVQFSASRAALLVDETLPACAAIATAFAREWRSVAERKLHSFEIKGTELPAHLPNRLSKAEAQVLVVAATADHTSTAWQALEAAKLTLPIVFAGEAVQWQRIEADTDLRRKVHGLTTLVPGQFDEAGKKFLTRYRERHKEDADADACHGYEMIRILTAALRGTAGGGGLRLRDALAKAEEWPGLTGKIHFKEGCAIRPLYALRAGESTPLKTFAAEEQGEKGKPG